MLGIVEWHIHIISEPLGFRGNLYAFGGLRSSKSLRTAGLEYDFSVE